MPTGAKELAVIPTPSVALFVRGDPSSRVREWDAWLQSVDEVMRALRSEVSSLIDQVTALEGARQKLLLVDGIAAPVAVSGQAQIFVDQADGDLKVRFGDSVLKVIVVDT